MRKRTVKSTFGKEITINEALPPDELKKHDKADEIEEENAEKV